MSGFWLLVFVSLSAAASHASNPARYVWMGDLVPGENRGRYFGLRNTIMSLITMVLTFVVGKYLDANKTDQGFFYVCVIGVLSGVVSMIVLRLQPEPCTIQRQPSKPLLPALRADPEQAAPLRRSPPDSVLRSLT